MKPRIILALAPLLLLGLPMAAYAATTGSPSPSTGTAVPSPSPSQSPSPSPSSSTSPSPSPSSSTNPSPSPSNTTNPSPSPSSTATPSQTQQDQQTQQLIDQAKTQINGNVADSLSEVQRLSDTLNQNASELAQAQAQINASQARIDSLNQQITDLNDKINTTQQKIDDERAQIAILARQLYQAPDSLLMRLLQAGSVRDMVTQTSDLTEAALHADSLRQQLSNDLDSLNQDQQQRQSDLDAETQAQAQLSDALSQFQDLSSQEQQTSADLNTFISDAQSQLNGSGAWTSDLGQEIAATLADREQTLISDAEQEVWAQEQLWQSLNAGAIPQPGAQVASHPSVGTRFAWPIQGATLTQGFGPTSLAIEPSVFGYPHFHTGLDLASPLPTVTAAADGVVAVVGTGNTGYGNYVMIVHSGGFVTLYGHLTKATVTVGQQVIQGQPIGIEGSTGNSTGTHLHFEVRLNGTPVDPTPYLPAGGPAA